MVNLEIYSAYNNQHRQKLMQSARQSRHLNQMRMNQNEKDKALSGLLNWFLEKLTQSSSSLSDETGSIIEPSSGLLPE